MKCLVAFFLAVFLASAGAPGVRASGQQDYKPPVGPTPRTPSGKVDFSGVWEKPYVPDMSKDGKGQKGQPDLPFTSWGENEWKTYDAAEGDYTGACLPFGMTRSMNTPEPMQLMQSDKYLGFLFEQNSWFTVVPIDGRPHRDAIPTWFGDSVGHWEGDTLVVDTINFKRETSFPNSGANLHLIEKFTRTDADTLMYEFTIDDPSVWTRPFTAVVPMRKSDQPIYEYACHEGNYAMASILAGARAAEKAAEAKASK